MENLFVGITGRLREFLSVIEFLPSELSESVSYWSKYWPSWYLY